VIKAYYSYRQYFGFKWGAGVAAKNGTWNLLQVALVSKNASLKMALMD